MPHTASHGWRSVGAVAAGFLLTAFLSLGTDVVMHASGVFPPWGEPMRESLFWWATLYRVLYTVLGGFLTAALAPQRPMAHVIALGAVGAAVAIVGVAVTWNAGPSLGPRWYPVLLAVTALPCVWAGGLLHASLQRLKRQPAM